MNLILPVYLPRPDGTRLNELLKSFSELNAKVAESTFFGATQPLDGRHFAGVGRLLAGVESVQPPGKIGPKT
ncbi:hypothetical protein GF1_16180 [Desulfolithobacter dissulfuricans]|uniref:Uncharacterized protein n=1 Tax=Desulfolithobacter dissulfuricans TaxID=2795293 RepID=A0A915U2D9_9BACT|nr:hypothetical protein GF1_16180 [Desulfolithobacter dissulfuricans]